MHDDDRMVGRLLTRREVVALFGTSSVVAMVHPAAARLAPPQAGGPAGACVVRPQQTEGPYFVDKVLNRSDIRADPSSGALKDGAPLELTFYVSRVDDGGACVALPRAQVDVWQCDAMGMYSGVRDPRFDTSAEKFLRGYQITDSAGAARFTTVYPGWYPGRAVHIHFKVRTSPGESRGDEFTSQLYFDEELTDRVHARQPYAAHPGSRTHNDRDGIFRNGGTQLMLPVSAAGEGYAGSFTVAMRHGEPAPAGRGRRGGGRG
jgi:protocatechuate 3,4-dioxygenase beta subunit